MDIVSWLSGQIYFFILYSYSAFEKTDELKPLWWTKSCFIFTVKYGHFDMNFLENDLYNNTFKLMKENKNRLDVNFDIIFKISYSTTQSTYFFSQVVYKLMYNCTPVP